MRDPDFPVSHLMARILKIFLTDTSRSWSGGELIRSTGHPGGSIYPVIHRIRNLGWLQESYEPVGTCIVGRTAQRRTYRLTQQGAAEAYGVLFGLTQTYAPPGVEVRQVSYLTGSPA